MLVWETGAGMRGSGGRRRNLGCHGLFFPCRVECRVDRRLGRTRWSDCFRGLQYISRVVLCGLLRWLCYINIHGLLRLAAMVARVNKSNGRLRDLRPRRGNGLCRVGGLRALWDRLVLGNLQLRRRVLVQIGIAKGFGAPFGVAEKTSPSGCASRMLVPEIPGVCFLRAETNRSVLARIYFPCRTRRLAP